MHHTPKSDVSAFRPLGIPAVRHSGPERYAFRHSAFRPLPVVNCIKDTVRTWFGQAGAQSNCELILHWTRTKSCFIAHFDWNRRCFLSKLARVLDSSWISLRKMLKWLCHCVLTNE